MPTSPIQPRLEQVYREMQTAFLSEQQTPKDAVETHARIAQKLLDDWK